MKRNAKGLALQAAFAAAGVAAALVLVSALRGAPVVRVGPATVPTGYVTAHDAHYTLYAPSAQALREGQQELGWAVQRFRRHFGGDPRPLVVVLADSPAAFESIDLGGLRRRGQRLIPFLTSRHLQAADSSVLALDAGAVLEAGTGAARVVSVVDVRDDVPDLRVGDEVLSINGTPAADLPALARAFRAIPAGERVRVDVRRGGRLRAVEYRRTGADTLAARVYAQATARFTGQVKSLAHEACHGFVAGYADGLRGRRWRMGGYGHGALPDWFDEMAAALCEGDASRARRRALVLASPERWIPLAELARMEHPLSADRLAQAAARRGLIVEELPVQMLSGPLLQDALAGTRAELFYAQSLSLGEFLFARGGSASLQALARELAAGRSLDDALRRVNRTLPGVPSSAMKLEAEWVRWEREAGG